MTTPSIAKLGHVGLHVHDIEKEKAFYRDIVGLTVTDEDPGMGLVFMSARPEEEHHELLLCGGRNVDSDAKVVQQLSFRCNTLDDVIGYHKLFKEHGVKVDRMVTHGNAISVYFYDPENNRIELYYTTPFKVRQPLGEPIDLDKPDGDLLAFARSFEDKKGPPRGAQKPVR